jgi:hypothetical protein
MTAERYQHLGVCSMRKLLPKWIVEFKPQRTGRKAFSWNKGKSADQRVHAVKKIFDREGER